MTCATRLLYLLADTNCALVALPKTSSRAAVSFLREAMLSSTNCFCQAVLSSSPPGSWWPERWRSCGCWGGKITFSLRRCKRLDCVRRVAPSLGPRSCNTNPQDGCLLDCIPEQSWKRRRREYPAVAELSIKLQGHVQYDLHQMTLAT